MKDNAVKGPFKYDDYGQMIFDSNNQLVIDIRGWGMFQYEKHGEEQQKQFGEFVVAAMNEKWKKECKN